MSETESIARNTEFTPEIAHLSGEANTIPADPTHIPSCDPSEGNHPFFACEASEQTQRNDQRPTLADFKLVVKNVNSKRPFTQARQRVALVILYIYAF